MHQASSVESEDASRQTSDIFYLQGTNQKTAPLRWICSMEHSDTFQMGENDRNPINKIDLSVFSCIMAQFKKNQLFGPVGELHNILMVFKNSICVNQAAPLSIPSDIFWIFMVLAWLMWSSVLGVCWQCHAGLTSQCHNVKPIVKLLTRVTGFVSALASLIFSLDVL